MAKCQCHQLQGQAKPTRSGPNATYCHAALAIGRTWEGPETELEPCRLDPPEGPNPEVLVHWQCAYMHRSTQDGDW